MQLVCNWYAKHKLLAAASSFCQQKERRKIILGSTMWIGQHIEVFYGASSLCTLYIQHTQMDSLMPNFLFYG
jgi:hypothetical protein